MRACTDEAAGTSDIPGNDQLASEGHDACMVGSRSPGDGAGCCRQTSRLQGVEKPYTFSDPVRTNH